MKPNKFFKIACEHKRGCSCLIKYLNYLETNRGEVLRARPNAGRPPGTHDTVIGNNGIGRRWDYARFTRNAA